MRDIVLRLFLMEILNADLARPQSPSPRVLDLLQNRFDEVFIKLWTLEGAVTAKGAAITIWRSKPMTNQIVTTMGGATTIWRFIANDQSNCLLKFR